MWSDIAMNDSAESVRESALVDDLAERIRQRITAGEFPIGMQLRQAALANEFKVSRTPVREALRKLQAGGLITVTPHRGAVVRVPAPSENTTRSTVGAVVAMEAPDETTRLTAVPPDTCVFPTGVWLITDPEATVELDCVVTVPTARPAPVMRACAVA